MKNIGSIDKVIRVILGLALLSLFFVLDGYARLWGFVGVVFILTAFVGVCPLYLPFRINTNKTKK